MSNCEIVFRHSKLNLELSNVEQKMLNQVQHDEADKLEHSYTIMENERLHQGILLGDLVWNKTLPLYFAGNVG